MLIRPGAHDGRRQPGAHLAEVAVEALREADDAVLGDVVRVGAVSSPAIDAVLTMWPSSPCSSIRGTNARTPCTTPIRLMPSVQSQSASDPSHARSRSVAAVAATPALLNSTWTLPNVLNAASARSSDRAAADETSVAHGEHAAALRLDRRLGGGERLGLDVGEHELHPGVGEAVRASPARCRSPRR